MQIKLKLDVSKIELDGEYYCDEITHPEHKLPLRLAKELRTMRLNRDVQKLADILGSLMRLAKSPCFFEHSVLVELLAATKKQEEED